VPTNTAKAACRRIRVEGQQALREHAARFIEIDRSDVGHRTQIREHAQNVGGHPKNPRRQTLKSVQPLAPRRIGRPGGQFLDKGQRKSRQLLALLQGELQRPHLAAVAAVQSLRFRELQVQLAPPSFETSLPTARILANDRGVDEDAFPAPGLAQR
jgi:hypothetical protein